MKALVTVLAQAYRDTNRALAPLQRAGIAREMLNANQAARPFWEQSLDLADRLGLLPRVVEIATHDPTIAAFHTRIASVYEAHLAEQAAAAAPPTPIDPGSPVTAEELAEIERLDREATPGPWKILGDAGRLDIVTAQGQRRVARLRPNEHGIAALIAKSRALLPRLARDLAAERARTAEIEADRDALAAKIETMLRDEEDARALRLAEHAAREDVAGKLDALRAAVRAHRASARAAGRLHPQRDLDLWAAAKT